jgi:hypothetical protein
VTNTIEFIAVHLIHRDPTMRLRSPNFLLFLLAFVLAVAGVLQYLGIPIKIPEIPGVPLPNIKIPEIPGLSPPSAFWTLFCGWLLLFAASLGYGRRIRSDSGDGVGEVEPGAVQVEAKPA